MANLKAGENGISTRFQAGKEQAKIAKKGAKKSAEVRKEWKTFRECFQERLTPEDREKMMDVLRKKALNGDLKAFEILRDTMGEKPVEHIEQSNTDIIIDFGTIEGDE